MRSYYSYEVLFKVKQGGSVGIVLMTKWYEPLRNITVDVSAAQRALSFEISW